MTNNIEVLRELVDAVAAEYTSEDTERNEPDDSKVSFPEETCRITFGMIRRAKAALAAMGGQGEAKAALTEQQKADRDAVMYGTGFMLGGKHIPAQDVMVVQAPQQPEAQAVPEPPRYRMTTGHCPNKSAGSHDCGLHNLHCNWPKCDQRIELLNTTPPPSEQPEAQAGGAVAVYTAEEVDEAMEVLRGRHGSTALSDAVLDDMERVLRANDDTAPPAKVPEEPPYKVVAELMAWVPGRWENGTQFTEEQARQALKRAMLAAAPAPKEDA